MDYRILEGSVLDTLPAIPKGSIDCVITSPPYWSLRSYLPKNHALKPLELGSEKMPAEFVANLVRVFGLVREAMADHAVCFLNIGDTYANSGGHTKQGDTSQRKGRRNVEAQLEQKGVIPEGIAAGNLCLIPQRLAIALQDDGWIVRSVIVWHKPAPMPQSLSGWQWRRCRVQTSGRSETKDPRGGFRQGDATRERDGSAHRVATWRDCEGCPKCSPTGGYVLRRGSWRPTSAWEPILMLAKSSTYFADGEPVKTPSTGQQGAAARFYRHTGSRQAPDGRNSQSGHEAYEVAREDDGSANARDVQSWVAEPLREKHYAAFPTALVTWCLKAGTSAKGYCPACGAPWVRVVDSEFRPTQDPANGKTGQKGLDESNGQGEWPRGINATTTLGWRPSCKCPAHEPRPGVVLDPFCGSGRTGVACQRLGLDFTGCELNPTYCEMARRILTEADPLFTKETG